MTTQDPMLHATPDPERELFENLSKSCNGFSADQVIGAAVNLVVNAIRQSQTNRAGAEKRFDELFGRTKQILLDHYDMLGRKRGVFPYHQTIVLPHIRKQ